jgi:hypothetical protein
VKTVHLGIVQALWLLGLPHRQPQPQRRIVLDGFDASKELAEGPQAGRITQHRTGRRKRKCEVQFCRRTYGRNRPTFRYLLD